MQRSVVVAMTPLSASPIDEALLPTDERDGAGLAQPKSSESSSNPWPRYLLFSVLFVGIMNAVLMSVLVTQLHNAQGEVAQVKSQFAAVLPMAQKLSSVLDEASRVLHGNLPNLANDLLQSDYFHLSQNVSKLSSAVQAVFDSSSDPDMTNVAKYSSLVSSVASRLSTLTPVFGPRPVPSDDAGVLNVLSYVTDWANQQADPLPWKNAGATCTAFLATALSIDWSGTYVWHNGQSGASWNVNNWKDTMQTIYGYCDMVAKLNPAQIQIMLGNKAK